MLTDSDRARIAQAIGKAESGTSGEISCVLAGEVSHYREVPIAWAALAALIVPAAALMAGFRPLDVAQTFMGWGAAGQAIDPHRAIVLALSVYTTLQAVLFAIVAALAWIAPVRRALTPRFLKRHRTHEAAQRHFLAAGAHLKQGQPYVLIFASQAERAVEILASEEIHKHTGNAVWERATVALTGGMKAGRPGDGFIQAIAIVAGEMTTHFPDEGDRTNDLPDALIET
jgi:putative membrane protein